MKWRVFLIVWAIGLFSAGFALRFFYHLYTYSTIEARLLRCTLLPESHEYYNCLREVLKNRVNSVTIPQILRMIPTVTKTSQDSSGLFSCHDIAHVVGDLASRGKDTTASLVAACGSMCKYGCVHAVILGRMRQNPSLLNNPDAFCISAGGQKLKRSDSDTANCYHGIGHVFAEYSGYDITVALGRCDGITSDTLQEECAGGIFMEVFQPPLLNHPAKPSPESPLAFCSQMPKKYKEYCLTDSAILHYQISKNIENGLALCRKLPSDSASRCGKVVGHAVYGQAYGQSDVILTRCSQASDFFSSCLIGAVEESLKFDPSGQRTDQLCQVLSREGLHFCEQVLKEAQGE